MPMLNTADTLTNEPQQIVGLRLLQHLRRHIPLFTDVPRPIHQPEGALAELVDQHVPPRKQRAHTHQLPHSPSSARRDQPCRCQVYW